MPFTHVVLFQFKDSVDAEAIQAASTQFLNFVQDCVHPTTQKPYVLSVKGGKDNSIEPFQNGHTHGFVVEFATAEDRAYYVKEDPVHAAFIKSAGGLVEKITVVDFTSGEF